MKNNKTIRLTEGDLRLLIREFIGGAIAAARKKAKKKGGKDKQGFMSGGGYYGEWSGEEAGEGLGVPEADKAENGELLDEEDDADEADY